MSVGEGVGCRACELSFDVTIADDSMQALGTLAHQTRQEGKRSSEFFPRNI